jgi:hypothetical protein
MKNWLAALPVLAASAALVPARPTQDKKPDTPAPARVVVTDTVTGFSRNLGDKSMELRLQAPRGKDMISGAVYVHVPARVAGEPPPSRKPIAFEGRLTTKDVQVGATRSVPARPILAKSLQLIADKITVIDPTNEAAFPAPGSAWVHGVAVHGKFKVGAAEFSPLAVENGSQPIVLTGKAVKGLDDPATIKGTIRASGKLRLGEQGTLVLDAEKIEAGK